MDQILSDEFLSKISKLFWGWKLTSIDLISHPAKLIESYKTLEIKPCGLGSRIQDMDADLIYW